MNYPVIDPVGTGINLKTLITDNGYTIAGIDNMLALSILLNVTINDILVTK